MVRRDAKDLMSRLLMGAKPSPVRRVRLPAEDRVLLAATQQDTPQATRQDKSLIHKEKSQYSIQGTEHVTVHVTEHVTDQDTDQDTDQVGDRVAVLTGGEKPRMPQRNG